MRSRRGDRQSLMTRIRAGAVENAFMLLLSIQAVTRDEKTYLRSYKIKGQQLRENEEAEIVASKRESG
jgi:hypothetical protein